MCRAARPRPARVKMPRDRKHASAYRYVRKVKGFKYQCRPWLPLPVGSLNLGCFRSEWEAGHAAREFVRRFVPGVTLAEVVDGLRRDGLVAPHVRLKYVADRPGGGFMATVRKGGRRFDLPGPFATEIEAHAAMIAHLATLALNLKAG